jgi:hypothetical protein
MNDLPLILFSHAPPTISDWEKATIINSNLLSDALIHHLVHGHNQIAILFGIHR